MIATEEVKVRIPKVFTSEYIENELKEMGYDVLRWAITNYDDNFYTISIAFVC